MGRDWWMVVILSAFLVALVVILFLGEAVKIKTQFGESNLKERDENFSGNPDDVGGGSVGGSESGVSGGEKVVAIGDVAPNIDEAECGFYFEEYGICAGTCPDGECISEGRSCYCKKVG